MSNTSATKRRSSSLSEQALLNALMSVLKSPDFGILTVYGDGPIEPSVLKTVTVIVLIVVEGRGKDKYINGSNVMDTFLQSGQTNVDLYWPCQ